MSDDTFFHELARWAAADRAREEATGRMRTRSLADQDAGTASWAGLLLDLAEQRAHVVLGLVGGPLDGTLVGATADFCVVERSGRRPTLVRSAAIRTLTHDASVRRASGDRRPVLDLSFGAALDGLAGEQAPVTLRLGAERLAGLLIGLGADILTIRGETPPRRYTYVPMAAVDAVEVR